MHVIQLQEFTLYQSCRIFFTGNQNFLALTYHCFQDQFENPLYQFFIKPICLKQCIVLDVVLNDFLIRFDSIYLIRIASYLIVIRR